MYQMTKLTSVFLLFYGVITIQKHKVFIWIVKYNKILGIVHTNKLGNGFI